MIRVSEIPPLAKAILEEQGDVFPDVPDITHRSLANEAVFLEYKFNGLRVWLSEIGEQMYHGHSTNKRHILERCWLLAAAAAETEVEDDEFDYALGYEFTPYGNGEVASAQYGVGAFRSDNTRDTLREFRACSESLHAVACVMGPRAVALFRGDESARLFANGELE